MFTIWTTCKDKSAVESVVKPTLQKYAIKDHVTHFHEPGMLLEPDGVILVLGTQLLNLLQENSILKKGRAIASLRSQLHPYKDGYYVVSYDPSVETTDYQLYMSLRWDVELACRKYKTGETLPKIGNYQVVKDFNHAWNLINKKMGEDRGFVMVTLDLETMGLNPWLESKKILSVSITFECGTAYMLFLHDQDGELRPTQRLWLNFIINHPKVLLTGAHLKYDLLWMWLKWGLESSRFTFDTLLAGSLIDENMSNSLNSHAKVYTAMGGYDDLFNAKFDKGHMELVPQADLIPYAGGDTDACYQVAQFLKKELGLDKLLRRFYLEILHPASRVFELMERTGCKVDVQYYNELQSELEADAKILLARCLDKIPADILQDAYKKLKKGEAPKLTPNMMKEYLFGDRGLGLIPGMFTAKAKGADWKGASTAGEHFDMFATNKKAKPFIDDYTGLQQTTKTLGTYVTGFLKHLGPDGCFHPSYFLFHGQDTDEAGGTVTGRTSARDPAIQCLKGDTNILTDRGWVAIEAIVSSYEKGEFFKVLTHTGRWQKVIGVYRNGVRPVFSVSSENGIVVNSTENHPYLTNRGWVRTDELLKGDTIYELRPQNQEVYQSEPLVDRYPHGRSLDEKEDIQLRVFQATKVGAIVPLGEFETFDLTIEGSHSFVANGIVVHNTLPKHSKWAKKLRRAFIAPQGYVIVGADYSEGELKIIADRANDPVMIQSYKDGLSLHAVTAAGILKIPIGEFMAMKQSDPDFFSEKRFGAKASNFGLAYGMGAEGFMNYARQTYGVIYTMAQAIQIRNDHFDLYPGLAPWHEREKNFARINGYVRNPLGRVRHLPLIKSPSNEARAREERRAVNSPIQSCLNDMLFYTMGLFYSRYEEEYLARIWMPTMMVHDSLYIYVKEQYVEKMAKNLKNMMETLPLEEKFGWKPKVDFTADCEAGYNLADMKEVSF